LFDGVRVHPIVNYTFGRHQFGAIFERGSPSGRELQHLFLTAARLSARHRWASVVNSACFGNHCGLGLQRLSRPAARFRITPRDMICTPASLNAS
jgi:hypothetical protein